MMYKIGCVGPHFRVTRPLLSAVTYPVVRGGPLFVPLELDRQCLCWEGSHEGSCASRAPQLLPRAPPGSVHGATLPQSTLCDRGAPFSVILWLSSAKGV